MTETWDDEGGRIETVCSVCKKAPVYLNNVCIFDWLKQNVDNTQKKWQGLHMIHDIGMPELPSNQRWCVKKSSHSDCYYLHLEEKCLLGWRTIQKEMIYMGKHAESFDSEVRDTGAKIIHFYMVSTRAWDGIVT